MRTNALFFGRLFACQFTHRSLLDMLFMMAAGLAPCANAVEFTANSQISATNSLYEHQPIIVNNATVVMDGFHEFEALVLTNGGKVTHTQGAAGVHLRVQTAIVISTNSSLDVSAKGRGKPGNTGRSGGSYGGRGQDLSGTSNPTYGDALLPKDFGTGGGGNAECYGGGALWIEAPELVLEGQLLANGEHGWNYMSGGSGGSILVEVGVLRGGGWMRANGGNGNGYESVGGGGGRIAVYYESGQDFYPNHIECLGGKTGGSNGTIHISGAPVFYWNDWDTIFHDQAPLTWSIYSVNPATTRVDLTASQLGQVFNVIAAGPIKAALVWNTTHLPDGRYQIKAVFRRASGEVIGELTRGTVINNSVAWHSGVMSASATWSNDVVHVVEVTLTIASNATLTVEAGTIVKFVKGARLDVAVGGILNALGTSASEIVFTSLADDSAGGDTNYDEKESIPVPGEWGGVTVQGTGRLQSNEFTHFRYLKVSHSGILTANETWLGTYVHYLDHSVTIPSGVTLTILPGAILKLNLGKCLTIQAGGKLIAFGRVAEPIVITSLRDDAAGGDTNGDGDQTVPAAGDWGWIFAHGGQASFDYCQIRYGAGPSAGGWGPPGDPLTTKGMLKTTGAASLIVSNSVLLEAFYDGVLAWGGGVVLANSVLVGMDRAVCAHPGSPVAVVNCTLDNNRIGLLVHGGTLTAQNTIVANSAEAGVQYDFGTLAAVRYCNLWAPAKAGYVNYRNTPDATGRQGNISAEPRFRNRQQTNYRLTYGSPCIDAADGTQAPVADIMGAPRYTDYRSGHPGTAAANGEYADLGAYEFVEAAQSKMDLVLGAVIGPASAMVGQKATVSWTIANIGTEVATGPWHDQISLVLDEGGQSLAIPAGEVLTGVGIRLGPGQVHTTTNVVQVPGSVAGWHRWQVLINSRDEIFEGRNRTNNAGDSLAPVLLDLPPLSSGSPMSGSFAGPGSSVGCKLAPKPGQDLLLSLDLQALQGATELYVGRGYMPTPQRFDWRQQEWNAPDVHVLVPATAEQTYYVLAYARSLPGGSAPFHLSVSEPRFSLRSVEPAQVGNAGRVTLKLEGGQLSEDMSYELVDGWGKTNTARDLFSRDSSVIWATFELDQASLGRHHVQVNSHGQVQRLDAAVEVVPANPQPAAFEVIMPSAIRAGRPAAAVIKYSNPGNIDLRSPLAQVIGVNGLFRLTARSASGVWQKGPTSATGSEGDETLYTALASYLFTNPNGPAGIWPPGLTASVMVDVQPTNSSGELRLQVGIPPNPTVIDWTVSKDEMRPAHVHAEAWDAIYANFMDIVGTTFGQYNQVLSDNATYLSRFGDSTTPLDLSEEVLIGCLFHQSHMEPINARYYLGAMGRGRPAPWDARVIDRASEGIVELRQGASVWYYFQKRGTGYANLVSPNVTLEGDGPYTLTDIDGIRYGFASDGLLTFIEDHNGNRTRLVYANGRLLRIDHSNGDQTVITYNAHGRVDTMTESNGHFLRYFYDASGEHLVRMVGPAGTNGFAYLQGQGTAREHALAAMTGVNGSVIEMEYDSFGRCVRFGLSNTP